MISSPKYGRAVMVHTTNGLGPFIQVEGVLEAGEEGADFGGWA